MSMFCYQCQETAMGTGCTLKGVCGKTSEVANLQDLLLFVIRGIAVYNEHLRKEGHSSEKADKFIYDSLFITIAKKFPTQPNIFLRKDPVISHK